MLTGGNKKLKSKGKNKKINILQKIGIVTMYSIMYDGDVLVKCCGGIENKTLLEKVSAKAGSQWH